MRHTVGGWLKDATPKKYEVVLLSDVLPMWPLFSDAIFTEQGSVR